MDQLKGEVTTKYKVHFVVTLSGTFEDLSLVKMVVSWSFLPIHLSPVKSVAKTHETKKHIHHYLKTLDVMFFYATCAYVQAKPIELI